MISMHRLREYTLIGAVMVLGVILGTVYVHAAGSQVTLTLSEGELTSVEERVAQENKAIQIALADPRVKPLVEGKEVRIFSTFYTQGKLVYTNETTEEPGWIKDFKFGWDGKYRALVTIRYLDDTGYSIHVDITDRVVEEPRKVYWKGECFYFLTP
jgi:hypothetical protein